ncbi:MAG: extracellular solute-binding protein [Pseudomonadota bacterium]
MATFLRVDDFAVAAPAHGLSMHGEPELPRDFNHLPYANPAAPEGGVLRLGEAGSFDSLNPYILKGTAPWRLRFLTVESLLGRNWDEPFSLYGLIAETVETPPDRSWVEFTLRREARFSDGSPITVEDVIHSYRLLDAEGRPPYRGALANVASIEATGPRAVRFTLKEPDREAPLILGLRPILKKAQWEGRDFARASLKPLIASGPYVVAAAEAGRTVTLRRDPDWWARDLPLMRGQHNFREIRIEFFRDGNALWEAFKAGEIDVFNDGDATRWAAGYDFERARRGLVERSAIPHGRPSGLTGFVFNTRRPVFADIRVREALTHAFDFEWIQRTMLAGAYERTTSFFGGSELAHRAAATGAELALLEPHADALPDGALDAATAPPVSRGDGRNRQGLRRATALLEEAGWRVEGGVLRDASGKPFRFEILLGLSDHEATAGVFAEALKRLGIEASIRLVDGAQYQSRREAYDYDMIVNAWAPSLSPGVEQRLYWGSAAGRRPGSRNYAGVDSPAVDAAIDALTLSETREDLAAAARALDRALAAGRYVIPFWHASESWIAHSADLRFPERTPLYGDWLGFLPDVWWRAE